MSVEDPGLIKRGVYLPDNEDGEIIAVTVKIPTQLRAATGGENEVEVAGTTVGEAIESLFASIPTCENGLPRTVTCAASSTSTSPARTSASRMASILRSRTAPR